MKDNISQLVEGVRTGQVLPPEFASIVQTLDLEDLYEVLLQLGHKYSRLADMVLPKDMALSLFNEYFNSADASTIRWVLIFFMNNFGQRELINILKEKRETHRRKLEYSLYWLPKLLRGHSRELIEELITDKPMAIYTFEMYFRLASNSNNTRWTLVFGKNVLGEEEMIRLLKQWREIHPMQFEWSLHLLSSIITEQNSVLIEELKNEF